MNVTISWKQFYSVSLTVMRNIILTATKTIKFLTKFIHASIYRKPQSWVQVVAHFCNINISKPPAVFAKCPVPLSSMFPLMDVSSLWTSLSTSQISRLTTIVCKITEILWHTKECLVVKCVVLGTREVCDRKQENVTSEHKTLHHQSRLRHSRRTV